MRHSARPHRRKRLRTGGIIGVGIFLILIGILVIKIITYTSANPYRSSIVVVGEPVRIVSMASNKRGITIMEVPGSTVISALGGYGQYSLSSLWTLDAIDNKHGALFTSSVADAFGIPLFGFLVQENSTSVSDAEFLRSLFSWSDLPSILLSSDKRSSFTLFQWISWMLTVHSVSADNIERIDISNAIVEKTAPDNSSQSVLDESRLDYIVDKSFFDTMLRNEGVSVALYNTTDTPWVGQRVSRQLARLGILMVFVGNATNNIPSCQIHGDAQALTSNTAAFIHDYYHCSFSDAESSVGRETGADLVVLMGEREAAEYSAR